jgi:hypothetical protein
MPGGLPPIGAEIPLSVQAYSSQLEYQGSMLIVDFRGGLKERIEVNSEDPDNSVKLRTVGFKVQANAEDGSELFLEQKGADDWGLGRLALVRKLPPKLSCRLVLQVGLRAGAENKIVAQTGDDAPVVLVGTLSQFPPLGDVFQLESPVDLVDPDDGYTVAARLIGLPAKIGGI